MLHQAELSAERAPSLQSARCRNTSTGEGPTLAPEDGPSTAVAESAKQFQLRYTNEQQPLRSDGGTILLSPSRFAKYVASQTYAT
ncbi:MAG: hypothetical protein NTZ79_19045, partial [Proteobacteria bacterium]|nr:hypothetical protein [Pseudomonadota bacterium]